VRVASMGAREVRASFPFNRTRTVRRWSATTVMAFRSSAILDAGLLPQPFRMAARAGLHGRHLAQPRRVVVSHRQPRLAVARFHREAAGWPGEDPSQLRLRAAPLVDFEGSFKQRGSHSRKYFRGEKGTAHLVRGDGLPGSSNRSPPPGDGFHEGRSSLAVLGGIAGAPPPAPPPTPWPTASLRKTRAAETLFMENPPVPGIGPPTIVLSFRRGHQGRPPPASASSPLWPSRR